MTAPHGAVHPSEDAGVPLSEETTQAAQTAFHEAMMATLTAFLACKGPGRGDVAYQDALNRVRDLHWGALAEVRRLRALPCGAPPAADAGVPEVSALWHTTVAGRLHALWGCYCTDPAKVAFVEELQGALASVSPVPAPTPDAVQETDPYFVLDFCEGAIRDAITLDDGLDAAAGQSVLTMIANAKAARLATPHPPREGEIHPDTARLDWMEHHPEQARALFEWMCDDAEGTLRQEIDVRMADSCG